jgi:hypothetical protein
VNRRLQDNPHPLKGECKARKQEREERGGMQGKEAGEGGEGIRDSKAGIRCVIDKIIALNITQNHKLHTQIEHTPGHFTHEVEPSRT